MRLEHYRSASSFGQKIRALMTQAVAGLDGSPRLVAFPETIGFPLLLALDRSERLLVTSTVAGAAWDLVRQDWQQVLAALWRSRRLSLAAAFHSRAVRAYRVFVDAFAEAARLGNATVVAGTIFLPHIETEVVRGDHIAGPKVFNTAFTFSPEGRVLGRTHKVYLTAGFESRAGLSRGRLEALVPVRSSVGRLGVAVCLDGFFEGVIDTLDGRGAEVVVQPSANHAPWDRRWPADPDLSEGEAWLTSGLRHTIQDRRSIRYGVNPMLVGDVFDLHPRGRSSVVANLRYHPGALLEGYQGVLALAETSDREEVVQVTVELP